MGEQLSIAAIIEHWHTSWLSIHLVHPCHGKLHSCNTDICHSVYMIYDV